MLPKCECGCGKQVRLSDHRFLFGHTNRGRRLSEETKLKIAIANMKFRADGYCHVWGDKEYVNDCRKDACEHCGMTNDESLEKWNFCLDTHHLNGKKECAPDDIQTLCKRCHVSLHNKGRKYSLEQRKKNSERQKGIKRSIEIRKKISESRKGLKHSIETRKKISRSIKEHWKERIRKT